MRDIKFRAWDEKSNEWISREFWIIGETTVFDMLKMQFEHSLERLNDIVIEQYTGLKDKNGKEIYEGDLLDVEDASGEVVFHKEYLGFFVKVSEYEQEWKPLYDIPIPEIIGNINENPELLK